MVKMPSHKAQANPLGENMPSKDGAKVDKSVMTPKDTGLSKVYETKAAAAAKVPSGKESISVAGHNFAK